ELYEGADRLAVLYAVFGPYTLEYTPNGRYMIVGGRKGHIAFMDMLNMELINEFEVSFRYLSSLSVCRFTSLLF
uniref:Uncharacterized protein n=1 Tax=Aegilops tauschii subsp. strangulata TaxID=200361 RepID=A0A452ZT55_AEGTS